MLTARNLALALGVGAALGLLHSAGFLLLQKADPRGIVLGAMVPTVFQALFLLVALALASDVKTVRVPRWVPFAIGATIATVCTGLVDWWVAFNVAPMIGIPVPFEPSAKEVGDYLWGWTPYLMIIAGFAVFGALQAQDAARRGRALRQLQIEQARVARATLEARLVALQARVEPRFLFRTLSDVEGIYERDPALGARVMDELIGYLRAALPAIDETSSSLDIEITLLRNWLDIMRIRSGDRLAFAVADEAPRDARLPPMLLLPLVQHAVGDGPDTTCAILVATARAGDRVRLSVTGPASAFAAMKPAAAVDAVRERLAALYGDTGSLVLQSAAHGRSQATLEIPYERTDRRPR